MTRGRRHQLSRGAGPVAGALTLALLVVGCGPNDQDEADDKVATYDRYVALGDSYTSAPLVPKSLPARGCLRSTGNYPHLAARQLGAKLSDRSCGGATTANLTVSQRPGISPQLDAVDRDTDLVTVSIGLADGNLFPTLVFGCVGVARDNPEGAPCKQAIREDGNDELRAIVNQSEFDVREVLDEIRDRAPDARVLVVGYPSIFPAGGRTCPDRLPLAPGDVAYAAGITVEMNEALEDAAARAEADYVDVYAATRGHDICAEDPWIQGADEAEDAMPYHPRAREQRVVAGLIVDLLS